MQILFKNNNTYNNITRVFKNNINIIMITIIVHFIVSYFILLAFFAWEEFLKRPWIFVNTSKRRQ